MLEKGFRAGGTILPSRFVKITGDSTVEQTGAGETIFGISQEFSRDVPVDVIPASGVNAAILDDQIRVFGQADVCLLDVDGSGGAITAGQTLKSDANGRGISLGVVATDETGAIALEGATTLGALIRVQVNIDTNN